MPLDEDAQVLLSAAPAVIGEVTQQAQSTWEVGKHVLGTAVDSFEGMQDTDKLYDEMSRAYLDGGDDAQANVLKLIEDYEALSQLRQGTDGERQRYEEMRKDISILNPLGLALAIGGDPAANIAGSAGYFQLKAIPTQLAFGAVGAGVGAATGAVEGAGVLSPELAVAQGIAGWNTGVTWGSRTAIAATGFRLAHADMVLKAVKNGEDFKRAWVAALPFSAASAASEVVTQQVLAGIIPKGVKAGYSDAMARNATRQAILKSKFSDVMLGEGDSLRRYIMSKPKPVMDALKGALQGLPSTVRTEVMQENIQEALLPTVFEMTMVELNFADRTPEEREKLKQKILEDGINSVLETTKNIAIGSATLHVVGRGAGNIVGRTLGSAESTLMSESSFERYTRRAKVQRSIDNIQRVLSKAGPSTYKQDKATWSDWAASAYERTKIGRIELQKQLTQAVGAFMEGATDQQILDAVKAEPPKTEAGTLDMLMNVPQEKITSDASRQGDSQLTLQGGITFEEKAPDFNTPLNEVNQLNQLLAGDLAALGKKRGLPGSSKGSRLRKVIAPYAQDENASGTVIPLLTGPNSGGYEPSFFAKRAIVQASEDRITQLETEQALWEAQHEEAEFDAALSGEEANIQNDPVYQQIESEIAYHRDIIYKVENGGLSPSEIYTASGGIRGTSSLDQIIQEEMFNFNRGRRKGKSEARQYYEGFQNTLVAAIRSSKVDDATKARYLARIRDVFTKKRGQSDAERVAQIEKELNAIAEEQRLERAEERLERIRSKVKTSKAKLPTGNVPYSTYQTFKISHEIETSENLQVLSDEVNTKLTDYYANPVSDDELIALLLKRHMINAMQGYDMNSAAGKEALSDYLWDAFQAGRNEWVLDQKKKIDARIQKVKLEALPEIQGNKPAPVEGDMRPTTVTNIVPRAIAGYLHGWFHDWQGRLDSISSDSSTFKLSEMYGVADVMSRAEQINLNMRDEYEQRIINAIGGDGSGSFLRYIQDAGQVLDLGTYTNTNGVKAEIYLSRMQIISLMLAQNRVEYTNNFVYGNKYTDEFWEKIDAALKPEDRAVAQTLSDFYESMYEVANDAWLERNGVPLPQSRSYIPVTIDRSTLKEHPTTPSTTMTPGSAMSTVDTTLPILPTEFHSTVLNYVDEWADYLSGKDERFEDIKAFVKNRKVKTAISSKYGPDVYKELVAGFERLTGVLPTESNTTRVIINPLRNFFFVKVLSMKPAQVLVQATSGLLATGPHTVDGVTFRVHPTDVMDGWERTAGSDGPQQLFRDLTFVRDRDRTFAPQQSDIRFGQRSLSDEILRKAIPESLKQSVPTSQELRTQSMWDTRFGDKMGSHSGGWAIYNRAIEAGVSHEAALNYVNNWMDTTQQSTRADRLSNIQLDPNTKWMADFLNAPMQQARWAYRSMLEARKADIRTPEGRIAYEKALANTFTGLVLVPFLVNSIRAGLFVGGATIATHIVTGLPAGEAPPEGDPLEEQLSDIFMASLMDAYNALPVFGQLIGYGFDAGYDALKYAVTGKGSTQDVYKLTAQSPALGWLLSFGQKNIGALKDFAKGEYEKGVAKSAELAGTVTEAALNMPFILNGIDRLSHVLAYLQGQENLETLTGGVAGLSNTTLEAQGGAAPKTEIALQVLDELAAQQSRERGTVNEPDPFADILPDADPSQTKGMLAPPNIDLTQRPVVLNKNGKISTVRSMSVTFDGVVYLIPTVARDGSRILSDDEAVDQFKQWGEHLGIFDSVDAADYFGEEVLHPAQDKMYSQTPE